MFITSVKKEEIKDLLKNGWEVIYVSEGGIEIRKDIK